MKITNNIIYVGVNDHKIDLFEGQYSVPNGMSYNSYVIIDEKIAVFDTVDTRFTTEWLTNLANALEDRSPDYLIVQHMEPDHSANIVNFIRAYPNAKIVSTSTSFTMMENFFGSIADDVKLVVKNGSTLSLGEHQLTFIAAPMVHWPEVMFTYESKEKILFSADAFGKFGALDCDEIWDDEARRYYIGIVGKYGPQVQAVLKKAASLDIRMICPLHGPILSDSLEYYFNKYNLWSSYTPEDDGIVIAYTSIYGNTKKAVFCLADKLKANGYQNVITLDLARTDWAEAVATAFRYPKLILATTTYNSDIFPFMRHFIDHLTERNFKNRIVGFIENGSWAPTAQRIMRSMLEKSKGITYLSTTCSIRSSMNEVNETQLSQMAKELSE